MQPQHTEPTQQECETAFDAVRDRLSGLPGWYTLAIDVDSKAFVAHDESSIAVRDLLRKVPTARGRIFLRKVGSNVFVHMRSSLTRRDE